MSRPSGRPELRVGVRVKAVYDDLVVVGVISERGRRWVRLEGVTVRMRLNVWDVQPMPEPTSRNGGSDA